jgi:hypothetical protein
MSGRDRSNTRFTQRVAFALALAATWLTLLPITAAAGEDPPTVVAWTNGELLEEDYRAWLAWQQLEPSTEAVRRLAIIVSLADAARERGAAETPEVQLAVENMRHAELLPALKRHIDDQVIITEDELAELVEIYPEAFHRPRKLLLRTIFKSLPDDEPARTAMRLQMQELRQQVAAGADIRALAETESESQSRFREGSVGFVDPEALPATVGDAVRDLQPGEISRLVEHAGGIAFYQCERISPAHHPDAAEQASKFRQNLFQQRSAAANRALLEQLDAGIRVTPAQDPVLQVGSRALPADWMDALIRIRLPDRDPASLSLQQRHRLLHEWGRRIAMADHAEALALGGPPEQSSRIRAWMLQHALATDELRHRIDRQLQPADDEALQALYKQRKDRLRNPARSRIAAVRFSDSNDVDAELIQRAERAVAGLQAGTASIDEVAREFARAGAARPAAELDWLTAQQLGSLDVGLVAPLRQLEPGESTPLLRLASGLWWIRLIEQQAATPMSFGEARESLAQLARQQQIRRLEAEIQARHLEQIELRITGH